MVFGVFDQADNLELPIRPARKIKSLPQRDLGPKVTPGHCFVDHRNLWHRRVRDARASSVLPGKIATGENFDPERLEESWSDPHALTGQIFVRRRCVAFGQNAIAPSIAAQ